MKVVHCKKEKYDVYIGRPSKWGNPFSHLPDVKGTTQVASRTEAVREYYKWITEGDGQPLLGCLHEIYGKTLGCWCSPKLCHGDVLVYLCYKIRQMEEQFISTTEGARFYLELHGIDPDQCVKEGLEFIENLKAKLNDKNRNKENP